MNISISDKYIALKLNELTVAYDYQQFKQAEKNGSVKSAKMNGKKRNSKGNCRNAGQKSLKTKSTLPMSFLPSLLDWNLQRRKNPQRYNLALLN